MKFGQQKQSINFIASESRDGVSYNKGDYCSVLMFLLHGKAEGHSHGTVDLHFDHGLSFGDGSSFGSRRGRSSLLKVGSNGDRVQVVQLDSLGAGNILIKRIVLENYRRKTNTAHR